MTLKTKVLHIFAGMNCGGAETFIMNIYRNIDRDKFQFDFAVSTSQKCFYDEEIEELGGQIIRLPNPKNGLLSYQKALKKVLISNGPYDVIHSHVHYFSGFTLEVSKKLNVPIRIAHSHSTNDGHKNKLIRNLYRMSMRYLIKKNATHMLGCSRAACEALYGNNCWEDKRVKVIPNAIDLSSYKNLPDKRTLRRKLKLPLNSPLIGHIGSFRYPKNHSFLIKVFSELLKRLPSVHLILVGDGPLKKNIKNLVKEIDIEKNVHFLGIRKDVPEILGALDLFLFPSLYEGLGIALIEAQAVGLQCIASNRIPRDVDFGMNMIKYLDLKSSTETWVKEIEECLKVSVRKNKNTNTAKCNKYDITLLVIDMSKIYTMEC